MEKEDGVFTEETEAVDNGVAGAEPETEKTDLPAQTGEADDKKTAIAPPRPEKYISRYEKVSYIIGTCSIGAFIGLINNYRGDCLLDNAEESNQQIPNIVICGRVCDVF